MTTIRELLATDHRQCDDYFVATEQVVSDGAWDKADTVFAGFRTAMWRHFAVEESVLFPAFEERTGMRMGPTQVMRTEHAQMRELLEAAEAALAARSSDDYSGYAETLLIMMQQHNMKEENVLYPMCDQHLAYQLDTLMPQIARAISGEEGK
jgi:hemerythrin-like domain-containing protein